MVPLHYLGPDPDRGVGEAQGVGRTAVRPIEYQHYFIRYFTSRVCHETWRVSPNSTFPPLPFLITKIPTNKLGSEKAMAKNTMKAVVFKEPRVVVVEDRPLPKIKEPTDIIVKVIYTALCGR